MYVGLLIVYLLFKLLKEVPILMDIILHMVLTLTLIMYEDPIRDFIITVVAVYMMYSYLIPAPLW